MKGKRGRGGVKRKKKERGEEEIKGENSWSFQMSFITVVDTIQVEIFNSPLFSRIGIYENCIRSPKRKNEKIVLTFIRRKKIL